MKSYRFLLFDADHTLLDFDEDMGIAFRKLYAAAGLQEQRPFSDALQRCYETCNQRWWGRFERQACTKEMLYRNRFRDFLEETGLSHDPDTLNDLYFAQLSKTGTPYPGAVQLMQTLSRDHQCYIITNGNAASQPRRIENAGLSPYCRDLFVSEAVGVGKPDLRYFRYVFRAIPDFSAAAALVIGDRLGADIQGAENAGVDSIWYNPHGLPRPSTARCTYEVRSYPEILRILGGP